MKLVIFILNNPDLQEIFLGELYRAGIRGGTILDSMGMAKKETEYQNEDLVSVLKQLFIIPRDSNKTMLFCMEEEKIPLFKKIVQEVTGGLDRPNTGFMMILPIDEVYGGFLTRKDTK